MPLPRFVLLIASVVFAAGLTIAVASLFGGFVGVSFPLLIGAAAVLWLSLRRAR